MADSHSAPSAFTRILAICVVVGIVLASAPVDAQMKHGDIRAVIKPGQKVWITDVHGRQLKGRIVDIRSGALTIAARRLRADVPYPEISQIDRPKDGVGDGALVGLGIGAALGAWTASSDDDNYQGDNPFCGMGLFDDCSRGGGAGFVVAGAGLGMLIGMALDSLIYSRDRAIYRSGARISLSPSLNHGTRGALLSVRW